MQLATGKKYDLKFTLSYFFILDLLIPLYCRSRFCIGTSLPSGENHFCIRQLASPRDIVTMAGQIST